MRKISIVTRSVILTAFFAALFLACNDSPTAPDVIPMYPLIKGMTWKYDIRIHTENFRPIDSTFMFTHINQHYTEQVRVADTVRLRDSLLTWKFTGTTTDSISYTQNFEQYYLASGNELLDVAYRGLGMCYPKRSTPMTYHFRGRSFASPAAIMAFVEESLPASAETDSLGLYYFTPPLKTLSYPLVTGNRWMYRAFEVVTAKEVTGFTAVETPAGSFTTAQVRWLMNYHPDGSYDTAWVVIDAVAPQGLINRTIILKDVYVTYDDPTPRGLIDMYDERVLTLRQVQ